ncbi:MAG: phosphodiester glycosidase family protein [Solirubrobacteraceae bacterium]
MRRSVLLWILLLLLVPAAAAAEVPSPAPGALLTEERTTPVAPGLELSTFQTYDRDGWIRWHLLTAELAEPGLRADLLANTITGKRILSQHAASAGAVAGINGDYFSINGSEAAIGPEIGGGALRKASSDPRTVAGVGRDEIGRLADLALEATVAVGARSRSVEGLNSSLPAEGVGVFTPLWGPGLRSFAAPGSPTTEVLVRDGRVESVRSGTSTEEVPQGAMILVGRGAGASWLAAARPGEPVDLSYAPKVSVPSPFEFALGSGGVLVRDGVVRSQGDLSDAGRTAIGWRGGGRELLLLAVQGRANNSRGADFQEVADVFGRLGAEDALMLDGGGSTEMVARTPGDAAVSVTNVPSDGNERPIPNGVGLFSEAGSGRLAGLDVRPGAARVFPGLSRDFTARGHDETFAPVDAGALRWKTAPGNLGRFDGATLRGGRSGSGQVRAGQANGSGDRGHGGDADDDEDGDDEEPPAGVEGRAPLVVLDDLELLSFDAQQLALEPGDSRLVRLVGEDAEGFTAPVHPRDVSLDYDAESIEVREEDGALRIVGRRDGSGTVLEATVQGVRGVLPVTVGLRNEPVATFDQGGGWYFSAAQANGGSVAFVDAPDRPGAEAGNRALALSYDFSGRPGTSAAYANAGPRAGQPQPITLPAGTQRLAMWVKGDGRRHWLRATLRSQGTTNVPFTFAREVDWTGWRRVEAVIPPGFAEPISLRQLYLVEPSGARKDRGEVLFDALDARVGQSLDVDRPVHEDPFVVGQGRLGADRWRFAVLSDAHTNATAGRDSFSGRQTISALRQIAEARPDFVVVSGDGVDTNRPEDFQFFEGLLDEYLGDIPVHWVPGNHESGSTATGTLANFTAATGRPPREQFDSSGIRFITLNSHLGSLRLSDFGQLLDLRRQLDEAAKDPTIRGIVAIDHHPPTDVSGGGASQLSDPLEADLLRRWLGDFREASGKHVALFSGHAHTAAVNRTDGLLEVNAPVVGKTPYGRADRGGFFGWMLVGADPRPERLSAGRPDPDSLDWLRAEVRPIIDGIELSAPERLAPGESAPVAGTGVNSLYPLRFPLAYPATAEWSGTGVAVVRGERDARSAARFPRTVAVLDLETMRITGVRAGSGRLEIASADQRTGIDLTVASGARTERGRARAGRAVAASSGVPPFDADNHHGPGDE